MRLRDVERFAKAKMEQHGLLPSWEFMFVETDNWVGFTWSEPKIIAVETVYARTFGREEVHDTVLHEIAHALCSELGHHKEWRKACKLTGAIPSPYVYGDVWERWKNAKRRKK